jgi:hypothetical protein
MKIKQLSIFVENRSGAILEITGILRDAGINIRAFSIADTQDFGIMRLIVDKPDAAELTLREKGVVTHITEVLGIKMPDRPGAFHAIMEALYEAGIFIEYGYAFVAKEENSAYVILRVEDEERAISAIREKGFAFVDEKAAYAD